MLFAIGNGVYWYHLDSEKKSIAAQMRLAEQKNRELAEIKARYMERQRQADAYKRRSMLSISCAPPERAGQPDAMIGETVNGTEAVWLNSLQDQGANVAIDACIEHGCRGQPDLQSPEDRLFPEHRDQGKHSGRAD